MKLKVDQQPEKNTPKWVRLLPRKARGPGVSVRLAACGPPRFKGVNLK